MTKILKPYLPTDGNSNAAQIMRLNDNTGLDNDVSDPIRGTVLRVVEGDGAEARIYILPFGSDPEAIPMEDSGIFIGPYQEIYLPCKVNDIVFVAGYVYLSTCGIESDIDWIVPEIPGMQSRLTSKKKLTWDNTKRSEKYYLRHPEMITNKSKR